MENEYTGSLRQQIYVDRECMDGSVRSWTNE